MRAVAFSIDDNYIKYGQTLLAGLVKYCDSADIYIRCINMSDENKELLRCIDSDVNIINDETNLSTCKNILKKLPDSREYFHTYKGNVFDWQGLENLKKVFYSEQAVYSCHSRFKTIIEVLPEVEALMCLDADTIVLKNINHMFDIYNSADMYTVPVKEDDTFTMFHNEGLMLINNTEDSLLFFNTVHDGIFASDRWKEWDIDTDVLSEAYDNQKTMTVGNLGSQYKDKKHSDDSYMWSGDGPRKENKDFQNKIIT